MYRKILKRLIGLLVSVLGLIVLLIPMLVISVAIKLDSKGSIIFKQKRLGKNRKEFTIYKFRTMIPNAFTIGGTNTYAGDLRITKIGVFLRRSSLDEVPQLINIIKGDMAIIGPRPILEMELSEVDDSKIYDDRFNILPGLFCSVDLDMRAMASRKSQFEMDVEYSHNVAFKNDVKLFLGVVKTVVKGSNVYKTKTDDTASEQQFEYTQNRRD